ncbi:hypothetical protein J2780_001228 [Chryseobacterium camelliae]|nr:hypothetical protein [Chryseobacterium camelliae]
MDKRLKNWTLWYLLLAIALVLQIVLYDWFTKFWA